MLGDFGAVVADAADLQSYSEEYIPQDMVQQPATYKLDQLLLICSILTVVDKKPTTVTESTLRTAVQLLSDTPLKNRLSLLF